MYPGSIYIVAMASFWWYKYMTCEPIRAHSTYLIHPADTEKASGINGVSFVASYHPLLLPFFRCVTGTQTCCLIKTWSLTIPIVALILSNLSLNHSPNQDLRNATLGLDCSHEFGQSHCLHQKTGHATRKVCYKQVKSAQHWKYSARLFLASRT